MSGSGNRVTAVRLRRSSAAGSSRHVGDAARMAMSVSTARLEQQVDRQNQTDWPMSQVLRLDKTKQKTQREISFSTRTRNRQHLSSTVNSKDPNRVKYSSRSSVKR